jgi:hypothetical protein
MGREILAAVMILVAEVSAGQLVLAHAWTRRGGASASVAAVSRLLTAIALAGILMPGLRILPNAAWEAAFAAITAWFAWCLWRQGRGRGSAVARGHYLPHLLQGAAMLYLFAALASPPVAAPGMSVSGMEGMPGMADASSGGMPALQVPLLALVFTLLLVALALRDLDQRADVDGSLGPAVKGSQVATGVIIAFTLIMMI